MKRTVATSLRAHLRGASAAVFVLILVLGTLGYFIELSGAISAAGSLVVETSAKKVQHPTGGVVAEIRVKDGDHVSSGQLLLRLDGTQARANLNIYNNL